MENEFTYAHNDTSSTEKPSVTARFNRPRVSRVLNRMREEAYAEEIPVCDDETLCFLGTLLRALNPARILELGTAIGSFSVYAAQICPRAHITTIERDPAFYARAVDNFEKAGVADRVRAISGDAGEEIEKLDGKFGFIFMDCAKAQYVKYLPVLKKLLEKGGALAADDVLLYGYVSGEREIPQKRKSLVAHVREYLDAAISDDELATTVLNVGDGVALSVKL